MLKGDTNNERTASKMRNETRQKFWLQKMDETDFSFENKSELSSWNYERLALGKPL